jgi:peroxiredoxin
VKIRYEQTLDDLVAFNLFHSENSAAVRKWRKSLMAMLAAILVLSLIFFGVLFRSVVPAMVGVVPVAALLLLLPRRIRTVSIARLRQLLSEGANRSSLGLHEMMLSDGVLVDAHELREQRISFKGLERVVATTDYIFVYVNSASALVVSRAGVREGDFDEVREALASLPCPFEYHEGSLKMDEFSPPGAKSKDQQGLRWLAACLFAAATLVLFLKVQVTAPPESLSKLVGQQAPDFAIADLSGSSWRLSDHRDKVVVLEFWATWCPPCVGSVPELKKLQAAYGHRPDFQMVGVSLDEAKAPLERFVAKQDIQWPQLFQIGRGWNNSAARLYEVESIPSTYVIDKTGVVRGYGLHGRELSEFVDTLLESG